MKAVVAGFQTDQGQMLLTGRSSAQVSAPDAHSVNPQHHAWGFNRAVPACRSPSY
jgi:hypothetical protein